jgi:3-hydroxy-D-aspartate aldolase
MLSRRPAEVGISVADVDTPALLLDLEPFERNLRKMADLASRSGVRLRPHAKTHKCAMIALKQLQSGAVGVCCQKTSEAEALAEGGITNILITNQIVGELKCRRLGALARQVQLAVITDHLDQIAAYSRAAEEFGSTLSVLVDVRVGGQRAGTDAGEPVLALAERVAAAPGLRFGGLQAYNGTAQHIRDWGERRAAYCKYVDKISETVELLASRGIPCETVTGSGTGTHKWEAESGIYTEIQPGSYIFMDTDYAANLDEAGAGWQDFEFSLYVLSSVMHCGEKDYALVDAGTKAVNIDVAMPAVSGRHGLSYVHAADEHGWLDVAPQTPDLKLGEKLRLAVGHCDPTVNLYDWMVCIRNGIVEAVWPITARGTVL